MPSKYILELFPVNDETNKLYAEKFHELFRHTKTLANGVTTFYRNNDNAGLDLYVANTYDVTGPTLLDLGVRARMVRAEAVQDMNDLTVHYWMPPRSSIWKNGITLANSIGVIDRTYRGNLMAAVLPIQGLTRIEKGTRVVQIVAPDMGYICEVRLCPLTLLDSTTRGEGGFGSTGK